MRACYKGEMSAHAGMIEGFRQKRASRKPTPLQISLKLLPKYCVRPTKGGSGYETTKHYVFDFVIADRRAGAIPHLLRWLGARRRAFVNQSGGGSTTYYDASHEIGRPIHLMKEIRVQYKFFNSSNRDIVTKVAFPVPDLPFGTDSDLAIPTDDPENILCFTTTVNNLPIATLVEQKALLNGIDKTDVLNWAFRWRHSQIKKTTILRKRHGIS